jgi:hypothetical protein
MTAPRPRKIFSGGGQSGLGTVWCGIKEPDAKKSAKSWAPERLGSFAYSPSAICRIPVSNTNTARKKFTGIGLANRTVKGEE